MRYFLGLLVALGLATPVLAQKKQGDNIRVDPTYVWVIHGYVLKHGTEFKGTGENVIKSLRFVADRNSPCGSVEVQVLVAPVPVRNENTLTLWRPEDAITVSSLCRLPFLVAGRLLEVTGGDLSVTLDANGFERIGTTPTILHGGRYVIYPKRDALQNALSQLVQAAFKQVVAKQRSSQ